MFPIPNPIKLFGDVVGGAVGGAVGWAWDKVIQGIFNWFASGLMMLMEWVWGVLDDGSSPRLTEDWFASDLVAPLAAISLSIIVALMLASAIQAGLGGRPELIADALKEGPKAIVATALTLVVMDMLVRGADALTEVIWGAGRGDVQSLLDGIAVILGGAGAVAGTFLGPLALLFGMIGLLVTAVVLFMRTALLYLVAAFAPIVWASSVSPMMRGAGRRLVQLAVALALAKPAIALTLIVGVKLVANAGAPGVEGEATDGAAALGTLVTGFACFLIAGLSPWVVFRLLPTVESAGVSSGIVGGWGRAGMTAASAALTIKSLGAASAASAATRALPQASAMSSTGPTGASGAVASAPTAAQLAAGSSGGTQAGPGGSHRPPVPPLPPPSPAPDTGGNSTGEQQRLSDDAPGPAEHGGR